MSKEVLTTLVFQQKIRLDHTHFFPVSSPLYQSDPSSRMAEMIFGVAKKDSFARCDSSSVVPADWSATLSAYLKSKGFEILTVRCVLV